MTDAAAFDRDVRLAVYRYFVDEGGPPAVSAVADVLGRPQNEVQASFLRLAAERVLVLAPGTSDVWMAAPLSATPTSFWVETPRGSWWGNCIWDALGIPAMLGCDGTVSTFCPDCNETFELRVEGAELGPVEGVAHFAVPARRWWENIGFT